ncbi:hypothetical protein EIP86_001713 [Pleurotus ostreatoroseus]|nr:hypothetical protein EIP86_001713 [Pleurotus ostreatoroseus]
MAPTTGRSSSVKMQERGGEPVGSKTRTAAMVVEGRFVAVEVEVKVGASRRGIRKAGLPEQLRATCSFQPADPGVRRQLKQPPAALMRSCSAGGRSGRGERAGRVAVVDVDADAGAEAGRTVDFEILVLETRASADAKTKARLSVEENVVFHDQVRDRVTGTGASEVFASRLECSDEGSSGGLCHLDAGKKNLRAWAVVGGGSGIDKKEHLEDVRAAVEPRGDGAVG